VYYEPARPVAPQAEAVLTREATDLDLEDVIGKRIVATRLTGTVTIRRRTQLPLSK